MGKQKWLLFLLTMIIFSAFAQQQIPASSINGKISIPVIIPGSAISAVLNELTPERQFINEKTETQEVDFVFNVSDGSTQFNSSGIVHHMKLSDGTGMIKKRSCSTVWNSTLCSPWISMRFNEIIGKASFSIDAKLNADYSIASKGKLISEIENLEWAGMDMAQIMKTFGWHYFEKDLNDLLAKECKKFNLKNKINAAWQTLQQPFPIRNNLYLKIHPQKLLYDDLSFHNGVAKTKIGLLCSPSVEDAKITPPLTSPLPLPNLTLNAAANDSKIELNMPLSVSYAWVSEMAKDSLKGKVYIRKTKKGREKIYLEIRDITVERSTDTHYDITVKVESKIFRTIFKKNKVPILWKGKIEYDSAKQSLYVKKFKTDVRTNNFLYNFSMETLMNLVFYNKIKKQLIYQVGAALSEQKKSFNALLQKKINIYKGMQLSGNMQEMVLLQFSCTPHHLMGILKVKGNASVEVNERP